MKKIAIIFIVICVCTKVQAQINLVLNPSFEQYTSCPVPPVWISPVNYWQPLDSLLTAADSFLGAVPVYCNICATYPAFSVPSNVAFFHYPRTGNGMVLLQMFDAIADTDFVDSTGITRWYLQGHLSHTLTAGRAYHVSFYTILAGRGSYIINHIGAYLDDGTIDTTHSPGSTQVQYTPQIDETAIISDSVNWTQVQGTFVASGTERLITIGNFRDRFHMSAVAIRAAGGAGGYYTYYMIDDVSVIDCSNVPFAGDDTLIHPGDSVFLGVNEALVPYTWYVRGDTIPFDTGAGVWVHPTVTTTYIVENGICGGGEVKKYDTVVVRVWPDTSSLMVNGELSAVHVRVYPSPAFNTLTVEHAKGCTAIIYDVVGGKVLSTPLTTDRATLDVSPLKTGVYMVEITDAATGFRVVREVLKE